MALFYRGVMIKTITRIGKSQGLIFDAELLKLTGLREDDKVKVTVHKGGRIVITPMRQTISEASVTRAARELIKRNVNLFERLSK